MLTAGLGGYRLRAALIPLGVIAYALIAIFGRPATQTELFPFFNWSLFTQSQNPKSLAVLEIHSINGETLDQPTEYYDLDLQFDSAARRDSRVMKAAEHLANAISMNDSARIDELRSLIEDHHMREAQQVEYDLVIATYDPIEKYMGGPDMSRRVVRSFAKQ